MAYRNDGLTYNFDPGQKASMIMVLDQFDEYYVTIHQIKESLRVSGSVVLYTQEAVILARLIAPYYSYLSDKLLAHHGIERYPALAPNEAEAQYFQIKERVT